jgi:hypothetical protein
MFWFIFSLVPLLLLHFTRIEYPLCTCHFGSPDRLICTWFAGELCLEGIRAWEYGAETSTVLCSKLPPFYFVWFFGLNTFVYNVAHDNFINWCWCHYLKYSSHCGYMVSQTWVAAFSLNQNEISSKNNTMIMDPGRHIFDCNPFKTLTCSIPISSFILFISSTHLPFCFSWSTLVWFYIPHSLTACIELLLHNCMPCSLISSFASSK